MSLLGGATEAFDRALHAERTGCTGPTCEQTIVWTVNAKGNRQPVNADPDPKGNLVLYLEHGQLRSRVEKKLAAQLRRSQGEDLWMPHHATCPDVGAFRKH